jgi:redox-sensitive bicupin YhaK (pirin superfamily)
MSQTDMSHPDATLRPLARILPAINTSDGAGVRLRRSLGSGEGTRLDPFLMLDEFSSDNPGDYIAGFPAHPHRGFETVTYILDGHMRHEDHLGHQGDLKSGGVQWMTAGRGIIHSEMPQQLEGKMRGFQLWINLPAKEKMKPAAYRDILPEEIPVHELSGGGRVKVIAGMLDADGVALPGPIAGLSTEPLYLDVQLPPGAAFTQGIARGLQAMAYVFEGQLKLAGTDQLLATHSAAILGDGDVASFEAGGQGARFLLLAGRPLNEPVVQYGPFVMNTVAEIKQAITDYQTGRLTA